MPLSNAFVSHFVHLTDPRASQEHCKHKLIDIFVITLLGTICGAENWSDIEQFGNDKHEWLSTLLALPNGIPSHDTFSRVFSLLNATELEHCFLAWVNSVAMVSEGEIIAIDGKQLRRAHNTSKGHPAIHMVSAWASKNQLVLGQQKVDDKSNEITAIPKLLSMLDIGGCVVTMDAMGCQKTIAEQIKAQGGDYVLAVKGNQHTLYESLQKLFKTAEKREFEDVFYAQDEAVEGEHGRIDMRQYTVLPCMYLCHMKKTWKGLKSLIHVRCRRQTNTSRGLTDRYYISSLTYEDFAKIKQAVRRHWSIENELHWCLDVGFNEDNNRSYIGNSAQNLAIVRHIALNLLKHEKSAKVGIAGKRKKAGWNHRYLAKVLDALNQPANV